MLKQVQFFGQTKAGIGAQSLFGDSGVFTKTAGAPPFSDWETGDQLRKFIAGISKEDRSKNCYVLVNALGAGEFFGPNINADYFPWNALTHEGDDYGYKTFLSAHAFQHHANKDPLRAFGIPVLSILNTRMKRVELIIKLDREKARLEQADGILTRIDHGEFPDVSMGCKVPYDVCSICGQKSKTRFDYCQHMMPPPEKKGTWGPNKILEDGRKICVINTLPRFFDISFVFIGADKTAKVMAKLASRGNQVCLGEVCAIPRPSAEVFALVDSRGRPFDLQEDLQKTADPMISNPTDGAQAASDWFSDSVAMHNQDTPEGQDSLRKLPKKEKALKKTADAFNQTKEASIKCEDCGSTASRKYGDGNTWVYACDGHCENGLERAAKLLGLESNDPSIKGMAIPKVAKIKKTASSQICGPCGKRCSECPNQPVCHNEKLASAFHVKTSAHKKLSEIIKNIPVGTFAMKKLPGLEQSEPDIPRESLDRLAEKVLGETCGATGSLGMVLKPHEFQRIVLVRMGKKDMADDLDSKGEVFRPTDRFDDSVSSEHSQEALDSVFSLLKDLVRQRTAFGSPFTMRVIIGSGENNSLPTRMPVQDSLLDKVSAAYNGYRRDLLMKLAGAVEQFKSDPRVREAVLGENLMSLTKSASGSNLSLDSLSYLMGAHMADRSTLTKTAVADAIAVHNLWLLDDEGHFAAQGF
jgi:hypothetical protein